MPGNPKGAPDTVQARIVKAYFSTTSSEARAGAYNYVEMTKCAKRGLGKWLDVRGKTVLDLGCGTAELSWLALNAGAAKVIGVNLCQEELDFASAQVGATFVCQDILEYLSAQPTESVDRIFALNILEHLSSNVLVEVLEESARVLRQDGEFIGLAPNGLSPYGGITRYGDVTHHRAFTPSSVRQLMRLCGFRKGEFREWGPQPYGFVSFVRFLLWQLIRATIAFRLLVEMGTSKEGIYTADLLFRLTK